MAFEDYENQECLCAWLAAMGDTPKQQLRAFVESARTILEASKAVWILVNTDYEDELAKVAAEALLATYQAVTDPIEAPLKYLISRTSPYADCPPVAGAAATIKKIAEETLEPIETLEYEIQQYIEAIEDNSVKTEYLDRLIANLDDFLDAIDKC